MRRLPGQPSLEQLMDKLRRGTGWPTRGNDLGMSVTAHCEIAANSAVLFQSNGFKLPKRKSWLVEPEIIWREQREKRQPRKLLIVNPDKGRIFEREWRAGHNGLPLDVV